MSRTLATGGDEPCGAGPPKPVSYSTALRCVIESAVLPPDFTTVSADEMAFALTLFVEAANRRVFPQTRTTADAADEVCGQLYSTLCADVAALPAARGSVPPEHETTLFAAFNTLCSYYTDDPLQTAVCARVLAFYFLMERSGGAALEGWSQPDPETPQLVGLHPAVIDALATVRLNGTVLLSQGSFRERVATVAAGRA